MERRQHRRVPAQLQGFLLGNSHETEAVTLDLSVGGARFDCDIEVYPGKVIRVRLVIPGAEEPVSIEEGRVQWVGEDTFGVSFQNVRQAEIDELEQLIDEYEEAEEPVAQTHDRAGWYPTRASWCAKPGLFLLRP